MANHFILAEFVDSNAMLAAARKLREEGIERVGKIEAYTPYPVHGLEEALGLPKSKVPLLVFGGGMTGAFSAIALQWFCNAYDYPINVGGKPLFSWPMAVPVTFELGVLLGAFGAFFGLFALLKLPRLHHPVFDAPEFRSASIDRFWISVETKAPDDERDRIRSRLSDLGAGLTTVVLDRSEG